MTLWYVLGMVRCTFVEMSGKMSREELMERLAINNVPKSLYSIDDGLKPDAHHLYKNYSVWEYFYLDERGGRNDHRVFHVSSEAFDFLWERIDIEMKYPPSEPPSTVWM
jgi:hypothetical protein